jgi:zinc transporter ZupT
MVLRFPCDAAVRALFASFVLSLVLCAGPAQSAPPSPSYEETGWDELLPESLRGKNVFGDLNVDALSDDDPAARLALAAHREQWKDAPPNPAMQGTRIKIYGFVVPLEWESESVLKEFLLVPYFGACIHVPPPPQNQIIHVVPEHPLEGVQSMDEVAVYGRLRIESSASDMGNAVYAVRADRVEAYGPPPEHLVPAAGITAACGFSVWLGCAAARSRKRMSARFFACGISFAAGILSCLGIAAVLAKPSWAAAGIFPASALGMAGVLHFLHRDGPDGVSRMRHTGQFAALAVAAHSIPECFVVFGAAAADLRLGLALAGAVIAHSIPLGIAVACPTGPDASAHPPPRTPILLAGLVPPVAAIALHMFMRSFFSPTRLELLFACAGGMMTTIAAMELIPSAARCGERSDVFRGWCAGVLFMLFIVAAVYTGR